MYIRKFRVLSLYSASLKSKFNIFVVSSDILNSYFHSPDLSRDKVHSSCMRKSPATRSSGSREGMSVSERERNTSLVVSGREQGCSTSVSVGEQGFVLSASLRGHDFTFDVPWRGHRRFSRVTSAKELSHAARVPDHHSPSSAICGTSAWLPRSCSGPFD